MKTPCGWAYRQTLERMKQTQNADFRIQTVSILKFIRVAVMASNRVR